MFEFRFFTDEGNAEKNNAPSEMTTFEWLAAKEIHPDIDFVEKIINTDCVSLFKCGTTTIKHVSSDAVNLLSEEMKECPLFTADKDHSDLVTGVYEGGLKIWECTYDLTNHIVEQKIDLESKNVLDMGCGAGIVGILAYLNGSSVHFQDYNEEIIKYITIPNVYLNRKINTEGNEVLNKCKFYSGDWQSFLSIIESDFVTENKFDYIFTCETIYNPNNYKKLHMVFKKLLKESGAVYLAAKTHYFGVGGGLRQFEDFMLKENVFDFCTCWKCSDGLQREILKISYKKSNV